MWQKLRWGTQEKGGWRTEVDPAGNTGERGSKPPQGERKVLDDMAGSTGERGVEHPHVQEVEQSLEPARISFHPVDNLSRVRKVVEVTVGHT